MPDYADINELHASEMPVTLDETKSIVKKLGDTEVTVSPVQIVREGDWAGVWRVTRIWWNGVLVGYVRIELDDRLVYMRPRWEAEEFVAVYTFGFPQRSISQVVRDATETLVLYYMTSSAELSKHSSPSQLYHKPTLRRIYP